MREIKFRAWEGTGMINVCDLAFYEDAYKINDDIRSHYEQWPLMQFTGLKDSKGKDIYEGDICSMDCLTAKEGTVIDNDVDEEPTFLVPPSNDYMLGEVKFKNGMFGLFFHSDEEGEYMAELDSDIEIIGNVYENPELI
jgi:uncharacterized phage protein (TIGR01671 family)